MSNQVWSLLLVTSTTSVLPSQWPRESPIHSLMSPADVRTAVERDDAVAVVVVVGDQHRARETAGSGTRPDS